MHTEANVVINTLCFDLVNILLTCINLIALRPNLSQSEAITCLKQMAGCIEVNSPQKSLIVLDLPGGHEYKAATMNDPRVAEK